MGDEQTRNIQSIHYSRIHISSRSSGLSNSMSIWLCCAWFRLSPCTALVTNYESYNQIMFTKITAWLRPSIVEMLKLSWGKHGCPLFNGQINTPQRPAIAYFSVHSVPICQSLNRPTDWHLAVCVRAPAYVKPLSPLLFTPTSHATVLAPSPLSLTRSPT